MNNRDKPPLARVATLHCVTLITRDSQEAILWMLKIDRAA